MKKTTMLSVLLLIVCSMYSGINWARGHGGGHGGFHGGGHHSGFGFYFGAPFYPYPYYRYPYGYPYYYPPAVITVPSTPPVYIQQTPPVTQQYPSGYWYYCTSPEGYYPYVKECPNGWQQVEPTPSAPR